MDNPEITSSTGATQSLERALPEDDDPRMESPGSSDRRPIPLTTRPRRFSLRRGLFAQGQQKKLGLPFTSGNATMMKEGIEATPLENHEEPRFGGNFDDTNLPGADSGETDDGGISGNMRKSELSWTKITTGFKLNKASLWFKEHALRGKFWLHDVSPTSGLRHIDLNTTRAVPLIDEKTGTQYVGNSIRSSRYTFWNFIPSQLWFQFSKFANFFFLVVGILQLIPGLSTTGTYTTILPLLLFLTFSICREGYDDFRRYRLDKVENRRLARVLSGCQAGSVQSDNFSIHTKRGRKWWNTIRGNNKDQVFGAEKSDRSDSNATSKVAVNDKSGNPSPNQWATVKWMDLKVGDIIELSRDEQFPADVVLLYSDGRDESAYVETMALDGETNLKPKYSLSPVAKRCKTANGISTCRAHFVVEEPNLDLYSFDGKVSIEGETMPLTLNNVVFRSSILRNTNKAVGMIINTGEECKIRLNATQKPKAKAAVMQSTTNRVVILLSVFLVLLSIGCSAGYEIWARVFENKAWYLAGARIPLEDISIAFVIEFNNLIPLALYVSMEIIKFAQFMLLQDIEMYDPVTDTPMVSNTQTIFENLGQVTHIFSDKTGTLTQNDMRFRKMSVAGTAWVHNDVGDEAAIENGMTGATGKVVESDLNLENSFSNRMGRVISPAISENLSVNAQRIPTRTTEIVSKEPDTHDLLEYLQNSPNTLLARRIRFFLLSLALCHSCFPEAQENGEIDFQATSPDELALVKAAQDMGYLVVDRSSRSIDLLTHSAGSGLEVRETYEVLDLIEFSSTRKRMSIIVRFPDRRIHIFCKGADSVIQQRLKLSSLAAQMSSKVKRVNSQIAEEEASEVLLRRSFQSDARSSFQKSSLSLNRRSVDTRRPGLKRGKSNMDDSLKEVHQVAQEIQQSAQSSAPSAFSALKNQDQIRPSMDSERKVSSRSISTLSRMISKDQSSNDDVIFENCFQHIDEFASEGLRTLLFGYRFVAEEEYSSWKEIFHRATTSLVNRQEMIESAGELIERDLELAGATAIEDRLQHGVPDTIEKLQSASIKIWMLTGDKRETAINIAHSARICKTYSRIITLDQAHDLHQQITSAYFELSLGKIAHSVIVIDGRTLSAIQLEDDLVKKFYQLLLRVDSVICCRFTPGQKSEMVKKIRHLIPSTVTLAIGDGGNDIAMIQEAHVGVGISGKEGLQAARVADYSVAQFRFLQRLLLVHGHWNYVRTSRYILYTFWKEMMFYSIQIWYSRYNGYTGTSMYENASLTVWNILCTSLCVIIPGIFEQDLSAMTLLAVPELYSYGQERKGFNMKNYGAWTLMAVVESLIIYFMIFSLYGMIPLVQDQGIFAIGDLAFSVCVVFINFKLLVLKYHYKTWIPLFSAAFTITGWCIWNLLLSVIYANSSGPYAVYHGYTEHFGRDATWWVVHVVVLGVLTVLELGVDMLQRLFWPSLIDTWQILEQDEDVKERLNASVGRDGYGLRRVETGIDQSC